MLCEPELNQPIETFWGLLKRRVLPKFTQLMIQKKATRAKCIRLVKEECALIPLEMKQNLLRAHHGTLQTLVDHLMEEDYKKGIGRL